jgi:hypothetical protein
MSFLSLLGGLGGSFLGGPAGGAIGSALGSMYDSRKTLGRVDTANREATDRALALQKQMYENQLGYNQPYQQAGINALNRMSTGDVMGPQDTGYNFRLKEGLKALNDTAAARGNYFSSGALNNAQRFGQGLASTEYQNAFNRQAQLAGLGQNATGMMGGAGQNYANQAGGYYMNRGNEQANALLTGNQQNQSAYGSIGNTLSNAMSNSGYNGLGSMRGLGSSWLNKLFS